MNWYAQAVLENTIVFRELFLYITFLLLGYYIGKCSILLNGNIKITRTTTKGVDKHDARPGQSN